MEDRALEIDVLQVIKSVLRRWWILLLSALLCAGGVFTYTWYMVTPRYRSEALLYVNSSSALTEVLSISSGSLTAARYLIDTYSVILKSKMTLDEVIAVSGVPYTYGQLSGMVSAGSVNDTSVLKISVTSTDPEEAALIANTIVEVLPKQISTIVHGSSVEVVDMATINPSAISPNYQRNTLIGFLAGAVLAAACVVIYDLFIHDAIETEDFAHTLFEDKFPLLATIPDVNGKKKHGYRYKQYYRYGSKYGYKSYYGKDYSSKAYGQAYTQTNGQAAPAVAPDEPRFGASLDFLSSEAYNRLRTCIEFTLPKKESGGRILGVTSACPQEGKSFSTINLAYSLAKNGYKVLLLDTDLRRPSIAKSLKLPLAPGLSNILAGAPEKTLHQDVLHPNLSVVTAGSIPPNPSELVGSNGMKNVLDFFAKKYDFVMVDLPPVNSVVDPLAISKFLDGIVVVVRHQSTRRKELTHCVYQLEFTKANILGFVYNGYTDAAGYYSRRGKYGKYKYGKYYNKYYSRYGYYSSDSDSSSESEHTNKTNG